MNRHIVAINRAISAIDEAKAEIGTARNISIMHSTSSAISLEAALKHLETVKMFIEEARRKA